MKIQNSYEQSDYGKLYLVPTPIGNLDDMTFRAVNVLKEVDLIAAEDTRHTKKLLSHFSIHNKLISYHEHNRFERIPILLEKLRQGKHIALVSDAGMPAISDPGFELVREAIANDVSVIVLPGANAAVSALVGSGLATESFYFHGFLPRKNRDKLDVLERLKHLQATIIFYESPHRVLDTLQALKQQFGDRNAALARELTKIYEQYIRGTIDEIAQYVKQHPLRGECVIVVEGYSGEAAPADDEWWEELTLEEHVLYYEKEENLSHKEAMKRAAKDRNMSKRDVYQALHVKKTE